MVGVGIVFGYSVANPMGKGEFGAHPSSIVGVAVGGALGFLVAVIANKRADSGLDPSGDDFDQPGDRQ